MALRLPVHHAISGRRPQRTHFCASLLARGCVISGRWPRRPRFCASLFARGRAISGRSPRRTHFCASLFARGRAISGRRPRRIHFCASLFARRHSISGRRPRHARAQACTRDLGTTSFALFLSFFLTDSGIRQFNEYSRLCLGKWASPAYDTVDPRNAGHMAKTRSSHAYNRGLSDAVDKTATPYGKPIMRQS